MATSIGVWNIRVLATQTETADQAIVTAVVGHFEVIQHAAALTDHHQQTTAGVIVLVVAFEVFGEILDTFAQNRHLHLGLTGITGLGGIFFDELLFALSANRHRGLLLSVV